LVIALWALPAQAKARQSPAVTKSAVKDIVGADVPRALAAAKVLGTSGTKSALSGLLNALALGVHPAVAKAAIEGLGTIGNDSALDTLTHYVNHRLPKVRAASVRALGELKDRRVRKWVLRGLADGHPQVRAAAAEVATTRQWKQGIPALIVLLKKGEEAAARALAAFADAEIARQVAELSGTAPDASVARCLGGMLLRNDFGPDDVRVEVVEAIGRLPGNQTLEELTAYVASVPEKPPRKSRAKAEALIEARLSGGMQ